MAQLAASYDCSGLETSLLPALAAAGCSDLAFSLASSRASTHLRQHHQAAALAAVFNWTAALQPLLDLHRRSPTYPKYLSNPDMSLPPGQLHAADDALARPECK